VMVLSESESVFFGDGLGVLRGEFFGDLMSAFLGDM